MASPRTRRVLAELKPSDENNVSFPNILRRKFPRSLIIYSLIHNWNS